MKKILRFNDGEFAVLFETKNANKGYYVFDEQLKLISNNRFNYDNYEITDFYLNSSKELKFLVVEKMNPDNNIKIFESAKKWTAAIVSTLPKNIITTTISETNHKSDNNSMEIFPNPADDFITINLKPWEDWVVEIYDMLGVKLISEPIHPMTSSHRMNIEYLAQGVYFIKIGERVDKFVKM